MNRRLNLSGICFLISLMIVSCTAEYPEADGEYAMSLIEQQHQLGARVPGTDAHEKGAELIKNELALYADTVFSQTFNMKMSYSDEEIRFTNIFAVLNPDSSNTVFLCAHYDSRPFSSEQGIPTPGANDGASGTALLISLAKTLRDNPQGKRIILMMIDGEDGGTDEHKEEWFIGSKYYAQNPIYDIPDMCVLVDMIGDKDLAIHREGYSEIFNPGLNDRIFGTAELMGKTVFKNSMKYFIDDDHIPLNTIDYKCVVLIDFDYEYWHTPEDTPDKCSAESLKDVGDVLLRLIYE